MYYCIHNFKGLGGGGANAPPCPPLRCTPGMHALHYSLDSVSHANMHAHAHTHLIVVHAISKKGVGLINWVLF